MRIIRDRPGSFELEEVLRRPLFAHLATLSDDGPRDSPVWFLWEDEAIWIIGDDAADSFPARLRGHPSCALGIVQFERGIGLVRHVGIRGTASMEPFDRALAIRLLSRYLGGDRSKWDPRFLRSLETSTNVLVRVTPKTVVARDVSYEC